MSETELRLSTAELLANNASLLFARYYPDQVDQQAWDQVYDRFAEAEALAPYLLNRESVPYAALLYSGATVERFDHRDGNRRISAKSRVSPKRCWVRSCSSTSSPKPTWTRASTDIA